MVKPPPISLHIRHAEATGRARKILRELEEGDLLQRRIKWQATKALVAVREMSSVAAPKLKSLKRNSRTVELNRKRRERARGGAAA